MEAEAGIYLWKNGLRKDTPTLRSLLTGTFVNDIEKDMTLWEQGIRRGETMVSFYESEVESLKDKSVLDLGCGTGGISIAFSHNADYLVSSDLRKERVGLVRNRFDTNDVSNADVALLNGLEIPFRDSSFDLVIMNGVLEWLGINADGEDPKSIQEKGLRECARVLKKEGKLYLAIENRWYPKYLLRDPHAHLPAVDFLPRSVANLISRALKGVSYRNYLYSWSALDRLLQKTGFRMNKFFLPLFHYQFPLAIADMTDKQQILEKLEEIERNNSDDEFFIEVMGKSGRKRLRYYCTIPKLGHAP